MISPGSYAFRCNVRQQIRAHFKYYQTNTNFQTVHESHDLKMEFCPFDNDFKQLYARMCVLSSFVIILLRQNELAHLLNLLLLK